MSIMLSKVFINITLTPKYLYCEFAFHANFQCVVRMYGLKCIENANQSKARS